MRTITFFKEKKWKNFSQFINPNCLLLTITQQKKNNLPNYTSSTQISFLWYFCCQLRIVLNSCTFTVCTNTHIFFSFFRSVRRLGFITFSTRHSFLKLNCGNDCEFGSNNFNSNRTVFSSLGRASVEFFELPEEIVSNVTRFGSDIVIWFAP